MQELKNYNKEKLIINLVWANIFGVLILLPIVLLYGIPYYLLWHSKIDFNNLFDGLGLKEISFSGLYIFGILLFGIIAHELIHGITWSLFTRNGFKSIKFGVLWKMLTPYCHCKEPLRVRQYIIGAVAPAIFLGFVPAVLAIFTGNFGLLVFGIVFTMAAAGDFLIINLLRNENKDDFVQDHPSEAGCYIYRKSG